MGNYPYQPIKVESETRLLKLAPKASPDDTTIICTLVHVDLDAPPPFEALSYVWKNSIIGPLNDADPDMETYAWPMALGIGPPTRVIKASFRELSTHPELQSALWMTGFPRQKETIIIDGAKVEVGGELYTALKRLRPLWTDTDYGNGICVWIDALCINQNDIEERSKHVKQMGKIYSKAKKVRIWLGEEATDADRLAFEALDQLGGFFSELHDSGSMSNDSTVRQRFGMSERIQQLNWNCLSSLLNRAWFRRTWVIQEIALASSATMHLGRYNCDWGILSGIIHLLRSLDLDQNLWAYTEFTADVTLGLMNTLRSAEEHGKRLPLLTILQDSRSFNCTVEHDKVYSIINLAEDARLYPAPDYALSAEDVFKEFVMTQIHQTSSLNILYHCSKPSTASKLVLPSWVPDWTKECHHTPLYLSSLQCKNIGLSAPSFRFSTNPDTLIVRGRIKDTIQNVDHIRNIPRNPRKEAEPIGTVPDPHTGDDTKLWAGPDLNAEKHKDWILEHMQNLRDWVANVMSIAFPDQVISPEVFEALWRTFVCNQTLEGEIPPQAWGIQFSRFVSGTHRLDDDDGAWMEGVLRRPRELSRTWDLTERFETQYKQGLVDYMEFVKTNGMWCYNRRFFKTKHGDFGWGPSGVMEGDVLANINGMGFPLMLRPVSMGYEVIGDCYVHGIMLGEGVGIDEAGDIHLI
ncbi:heterokaryon incompatibility protein-domain-containing protein [Lophiotrema nucula]|uniref:Heterokaryon incompatibility protein-domain-containing protein n=1 Tax=Lophiotrema nucula TaxID=690887 RepID=A0A6A5Z7A2_9PLEO|nr:heterokaryon incompatibility protein-domain-containing protein [Lophiotrema nucula]